MNHDTLGIKGYSAIAGSVGTYYSWVENLGIAITALTGFLTMCLVIYSIIEKRKNINLIVITTENTKLENENLKRELKLKNEKQKSCHDFNNLNSSEYRWLQRESEETSTIPRSDTD